VIAVAVLSSQPITYYTEASVSRKYSMSVSQILFPVVAAAAVLFMAAQVATDVLASLETSPPAEHGACDLTNIGTTEHEVMHLVNAENIRRFDEDRTDAVMRLTQCMVPDSDADYSYAYDVSCPSGTKPVIVWNIRYNDGGRIKCLGVSAP
jgi:hypothetical protein